MLKTYALFDLIGMQAALEKGEAAKVLREFWAAVENWTNHQAKDVGRVTFEDGCTGTPMPRVVTFSERVGDGSAACTLRGKHEPGARNASTDP